MARYSSRSSLLSSTSLALPSKTVTEIIEQTEEKTLLQQDKGEVVELNLKSAR